MGCDGIPGSLRVPKHYLGKFYADAAVKLRNMENPKTRKSYTLAELDATFGIDRTTMVHLSGKKGQVTGEELLNVIFALLSDGDGSRTLYHLTGVLDRFRQCRQEVFGADTVFPVGVKQNLLNMVMKHNKDIK